ncbi:hypothetical protein [Paenibacillus sp. YPG26]|uniref:hypothetical protein n=1 Tax=Paenibacillus sp. YPG26 TaxID=2878915 RepID=UPI0020401E80|nr:hypothetical protein [Paenibacillus sp. YPG26]USB32461.1 hypothetical protein LDO05_14305 [Paenibacillus sp. YPG26]
MKVNLNFTNKGKIAIENFNNEELLEIFARYIRTLMKKYDIQVSVPAEDNRNIAEDGYITLIAENVKCEISTFFNELGRDIKVPLKKRLGAKVDNVFKTEVLE